VVLKGVSGESGCGLRVQLQRECENVEAVRWQRTAPERVLDVHDAFPENLRFGRYWCDETVLQWFRRHFCSFGHGFIYNWHFCADIRC
jgi:hypothetical protein